MTDTDKIRLLICTGCGAIEEMPDYEGPWQQDTWLNAKLKGHMLESGERTHGEVHIGKVSQNDWINYGDSIIAQAANEFTAPGKGAGLGQTFYDTKSNFSADAFACWKQHNRTTNCEDYRSDSKKLLPDTRAERRELGLDPKSRPNTYLCDFCPYNSIVMQRQRKAKGDYDYTG
jgi:hypothetical protein